MVVAKKRWGQHWLASAALAEALIDDVRPVTGERFLEIGPGTGRVTLPLLARDVEVTAIEIDPERARDLRAQLGRRPGFSLVEGDVLEADDDIPWDRAPYRLIGNLPYNVSGPILRWTASHRERLVDAHFMLQREVAERLCASAGDTAYGLLSARMQWEFEVGIVRRLSAGAFRPPPRVESAFVRLRPLDRSVAPPPTSAEAALMEGGFAHRRKTLANALGIAGHEPQAIRAALESIGLGAEARAEVLGPTAWRRLAAALDEEPA